MKGLVSWAGVRVSWHGNTMVGLIGRHHMCMCIHTHTHMRHRRTQFIIKYLAYFAARLRASAYYNNISGQLPAWLQLETRIHEPYDNNNNAMGRWGRGRGRGEFPNENASCPALGSVNVP